MQPTEHARVIVGIDGSSSARGAARWAAEAATRSAQTVHLIHAFEWPIPQYDFGGHLAGAMTDPYAGELHQAAESMLAGIADQIRAEFPRVPVTSEMLAGPGSRVLVDLSRAAAMIVVGSRGVGGFAGLLVGSVGTQLAGHAHCPVVVVHSEPAERSGRVVLGVDPPDESDAALEFAFSEAARLGAELTVVHAWATPPATGPGGTAPRTNDPDAISTQDRQALDDRLVPWRAKHPDLVVRARVEHGRPTEVILSASEGADLLVVGSHGHGALHDLILGSVSNSVLHSARCPVAIVPTRRGGRSAEQPRPAE